MVASSHIPLFYCQILVLAYKEWHYAIKKHEAKQKLEVWAVTRRTPARIPSTCSSDLKFRGNSSHRKKQDWIFQSNDLTNRRRVFIGCLHEHASGRLLFKCKQKTPISEPFLSPKTSRQNHLAVLCYLKLITAPAVQFKSLRPWKWHVVMKLKENGRQSCPGSKYPDCPVLPCTEMLMWREKATLPWVCSLTLPWLPSSHSSQIQGTWLTSDFF